MAQTAALNADELVKLFEKRSMKQAKTYIKQLKEKKEQAQIAINRALIYTLVKLKSTPVGIATSLAFYKNLLVSAELDYFQDNDCFDQKIHTAVQELCNYNSKQLPEERGRHYFKQKLKIPQTEQNQRLGITLILLALQIIQNFAKWYPKDYFEGDQTPSRFAKTYQKLLKSGVKFPQYGQDRVMKADDQNSFKKNFSEWIAKAEEVESMETKRPPIQQNANASVKDKSPAKSVINNQKMQKQPIKQVAASEVKLIKEQHKQQQKMQAKSPKKLQSDLKSGKQQSKVIVKAQSKPIQKPNAQANIKNQKQKPILIEKKDEKSKNQLYSLVKDKKIISNVEDSKVNSILPKQKQKNVNIQKAPSAIFPTKIETKPEYDAARNQNQHPERFLNTGKQEKGVKRQSLNNQKIVSQVSSHVPQTNFILNSQKSMKRSEKVKPVESSPKSSMSRVVEQQLNSGKQQPQRHKVYQLLNKIELLQKKNNQLQRTIRQKSEGKSYNQRFLLGQRVQIYDSASKRIMKMQHPSEGRIRNLSTQPIERNKKSLPKTQRRVNFAKQNPLDIISSKFQIDNIFSNVSSDLGNKLFQQKTKTLSSFRTEKQNKFSTGIYNSSRYTSDPIANKNYSVSLLKSISNLKLDEYQIPFLPQYFQPVKLEHKRLRQSALHLAGCTESGSSETFYSDHDIQVRLIKSSSKGVYILSFKNVGHRNILIEYRHKEMGRVQYYNYIKMMTQNTSKWDLQKGKYLDINFQFRISDLNFKFLQMLFHISNKPVCLFLPITLLDQCEISKRINLEKLGSYAQLHGKIVKSQPFIIKSPKLPDFMTNHSGLSSNQEMKLKGEFAVTLKTRNSQFTEFRHLDLFLVNLGGMNNKCQINTIIDSRLHDNQDFAKVMIELLTFLLAGHC